MLLSSYLSRADCGDDDLDPGDQRDVPTDQDHLRPMSGGLFARLLLVAGVALVTTQLIRGRAPALALLVSLAALVVLLGLLLPGLQTVWQRFQSLLAQSGLENSLFLPLLKVLAVTQITRLAAELCRDAGEKALAAKLELCGGAASLLCVLPLAEQALALLGALGT